MPEPLCPAFDEDRGTWRPMTRRAKVESVLICAVFVVYVVFALKLVLFSRTPGSERSLNLIPFASIWNYLVGGASVHRGSAFANLAGNIALFIPLGVFLAAMTKWRVTRVLLVVAAASVAVEVLQGVLAVGASDIDDVILNCVGGLLGFLLVLLLGAVLRSRERVRTVVAVLSVLMIPVFAFLLFAIRLRL